MRGYLNTKYTKDPSFSSTVFWYLEEPEKLNGEVYNSSAGGSYHQIDTYWKKDHETVKKYAETLDTNIGFLECDGRVYMICLLYTSKGIKAMDAVYENLFTPYGIMLNGPSYTVPDDDIGFVTRVYPGVKENGSVFSLSLIHIFSTAPPNMADTAKSTIAPTRIFFLLRYCISFPQSIAENSMIKDGPDKMKLTAASFWNVSYRPLPAGMMTMSAMTATFVRNKMCIRDSIR